MSETIFDALRESHETQRALVRKLQRTKSGETRNELFTALRIELAAHEASEERFLYCPMLMDDRGLHPSRDALAHHHKADKLVEELQQTDKSTSGWKATFKQLSNEIHEHLKEEERAFFQMAGKILTDKLKTTLAKKYRTDLARMKKKLMAESQAS